MRREDKISAASNRDEERSPKGRLSGVLGGLALGAFLATLSLAALADTDAQRSEEEEIQPLPPSPVEVLEERLQNLETRFQREEAALAAIQVKDASVISQLEAAISEGQRARDEGNMAHAAERAAVDALVKLSSEVEGAWAKCVAQEERTLPLMASLEKLRRERGALEPFAIRARRDRQVWAMKAILSDDLRVLRGFREEHRLVEDRQKALEKAKEAHGRRLKEERKKEEAAQTQQGELEALHRRLTHERRELERNVGALMSVQQEQEEALSALKEGTREDLPPEPDVFAVGHRGTLAFPAAGFIEVAFGKILDPRFNTVTFQNGLDIRAPKGGSVVTVSQGRVVYAAFFRGYGNLVIVDHGQGYHSLYAHLGEIRRQVGDHLLRGETLGTVGDTGSNKGAFLHFELRRHGRPVDPKDWFGDE